MTKPKKKALPAPKEDPSLLDTPFSPSALFEELQKSQLDPSVFEKIDERDISLAPNFFEFVTDNKYLNAQILPKQLEIGTKLFMDYCPDCSNPGYIDTLFDQSMGNIQNNVVFLIHGVCPKCHLTRYDFWKQKKLQDYNELVAALGQRAGKTKLVGLLATYVSHRFLKIPNPIRHFNQSAGDLLMGTFSALTAEQAEQTLWEAFKGFTEASPWFKNYHSFLKSEGKTLGIELFLERKSFYQYTHKQILWHYTGSEDKKMRGRTRIFASPDELGWMTSDEKKSTNQIMNADAVYTALSNSLATMRMKWSNIWSPTNFDSPPILMANISSPSSAKDKIMRLMKDAQRNPKIFAVNLPTWLCNNDYSFESLRQEFAHIDDNIFYRDFGAQPPLASNPYLTEARSIDRIATGERISIVAHQKVTELDGLGDKYISAKAVVSRQDKAIPRILTFDLGHRKNALSCCLFSMTADSKPKLDYAVALWPEPKVPVNLSHFFDNFTVPLVKSLNIKYAFFDRWQSLDQVSRLRDMGVDAKVHSLTYKAMDSVRGAILAQGLVVPKLDQEMSEYVKVYVEKDESAIQDAIALLGIQLLTVRDTGFQFLKPLEGDDDIFRAFALGIDRLSDPNVKKTFSKAPIQTQNGQAVRPLGSFRLKSSRDVGGMTGTVTSDSGRALGLVRTKRN